MAEQRDLFFDEPTIEPMTSEPLTSETPNSPEQQLAVWVERGWIRAIDRQLVRTLNELQPCAEPLMHWLVALLSHQYGRGHSCIDLNELLRNPDGLLSLPPENEYDQPFSDKPSQLLQNLGYQQLADVIQACPWVGEQAPLVWQAPRLYLQRLYRAEGMVQQKIRQRLTGKTLTINLADELDDLFGPDTTDAPNWQKLACALAVQQRFAIITGGPGTGKTTTVVRLLALISRNQPGARIRLAAPTGKAAARLTESISGAIAKLPEADQAQIPTDVATLHRLLGVAGRGFKHHAQRPLHADVVVVDEASMIDLELMSALLQALPEHCQLILLGDKDQLASVEAGSVFGDLCQGAQQGNYRPATIEKLQPFSNHSLVAYQTDEGSDYNQATVMLHHSYRFDANSGIGMLARAVNNGQSTGLELFNNAAYSDLSRLSPETVDNPAVKSLVVQGYAQYLRGLQTVLTDFDQWAISVIKSYQKFQVLAALKRGPWGVDGLNEQITHWLKQANLIPQKYGWYEGRPVMMNSNNYALGIMNGDIGITLYYPDHDNPEQKRLRVAFQMPDGSVKWVLPSRLTDVQTVYAMTVHKSQGSEFDHTVLVVPPTANPILTRELLYTGITRAKNKFTLVAQSDSVVQDAIARSVTRSSGL
ncbi:exodeoxyribonuclease V subunit alpha [Salinibius halmophilus]|uniref:exodeoxyribonuclease V subunit alpha n=1 Tax=Salinibius halmophilus TaxID=1853216 RepID=UPI0018F32E28|nr:exodeoxyribonuclease V subunit alpha [Salinibius halmophilus]